MTQTHACRFWNRVINVWDYTEIFPLKVIKLSKDCLKCYGVRWVRLETGMQTRLRVLYCIELHRVGFHDRRKKFEINTNLFTQA